MYQKGNISLPIPTSISLTACLSLGIKFYVVFQVSKLESQIDSSKFTMNQDEAVAKQKETRQETNRLRAVIKSRQTKLNKHNQKLQQARDKKNQLTGESLKIQAKVYNILCICQNL